VWQRDGGATALAAARLLPNTRAKQPRTSHAPQHTRHHRTRQHGNTPPGTHPKNPQKKREPTYNNRGWGPPTGVGRLDPSALAISPAPHTAERGGQLPDRVNVTR
jgi:hypothetical protein